MDDIVELVDLPAPSVQPLVHPLDLPEARRPFTFGWIVGILTGPAVGVALAAMVWDLSGSYLVPLVAAAGLVIPGVYFGRSLREEAWAFIPRKRQDRDRVLAPIWEIAEGVVVGGSIALTMVLVSTRIGDSDIPLGVRQFIVGSGAVAIVLVAFDLL